jgi:hypothetical protein
MKREADIKAPDGFILGGIRRIRKDGTILFQRGWWRAPAEWIDQDVWVHCSDSGAGDLEIAPPGLHIYTARSQRKTVWGQRTTRKDAQPTFRKADIKAWAAGRRP